MLSIIFVLTVDFAMDNAARRTARSLSTVVSFDSAHNYAVS